ncbi:hypothetical protein FRC03_000223 [Tulasnella sp. 419]|nr:hypothetical protein FRC03_000223 [Tulasnella sp. 419]
MDFLKKAMDQAQQGNHGNTEHNLGTGQTTQQHNSGGGGGGLMGFVNSSLGGGQSGEAKEDGLDKAIDFVQEKYLKQGAQDNESAMEQMKDEQISDAIRSGYKSVTGKEFFVADKS